MNSILEFFGFNSKEPSTTPKIIVWTMKGCSHCIMLKQYLKKNNWKYTEKVINNDNIKELQQALLKKSLKKITAPQVFINGKHIGGVRDTINYLKKLRQ